MPKTLQKVHKHIAKKRGAVEALHEFSRDARRLRRATARDDRVARVSANMSRGRQTYVDRIAYFYETLPEDATPMSEDEMKDIVVRYINRSVPEIEQLQSERRKGRPPSKREEALLQRTDVENKEFKTGFWLPDLSEQSVINSLRAWNGDWSGLSTMKFIRITKDGGKQPSVFPPRECLERFSSSSVFRVAKSWVLCYVAGISWDYGVMIAYNSHIDTYHIM